jgi:hypothetical protein
MWSSPIRRTGLDAFNSAVECRLWSCLLRMSRFVSVRVSPLASLFCNHTRVPVLRYLRSRPVNRSTPSTSLRALVWLSCGTCEGRYSCIAIPHSLEWGSLRAVRDRELPLPHCNCGPPSQLLYQAVTLGIWNAYSCTLVHVLVTTAGMTAQPQNPGRGPQGA